MFNGSISVGALIRLQHAGLRVNTPLVQLVSLINEYQQIGFPGYKARVSFDAVTLAHVPDTMRLLPGMSLRAGIKVGTRRVITFLTYPLIRRLDESRLDP